MTTYDQQAADFLNKWEIKFSAKLSNTKEPSWTTRGQHNHFLVKFSRGRKSVSFDYFDSEKNYQDGKTVIRPYDALACCSNELDCAETFEEFCGDFGYDLDSRSAEKTFRALKKMSKKMSAFFTGEMADELREIN